MSNQQDLFGDGNGNGTLPPECADCGTIIENRRFMSVGLCTDCGLKVGRAKRDGALDHHEAYRGQMISIIRSKLESLARRRPDRTVNANDAYEIRHEVRQNREKAGLPTPDDPDLRYLGALWRTDSFEKTGEYTPSDVPTHHGRPIPSWRYVPPEDR